MNQAAGGSGKGPAMRGTPGSVPDIPETPTPAQAKPAASNNPHRETGGAAPAGRAPAAQAGKALPAGVVERDLTKKPAAERDEVTGRPTIKGRPYTVECATEGEALALANSRGRAVAGPNGWVCPSVVRERVSP